MNKKGLIDDQAVIYKANEILPDEYSKKFIAAISELEDNDEHIKREFPVTRLHKVSGAKGVYRADIDKISGWRIHVKYGDDNRIHLCDILKDKEHDRVQTVLKSRKSRYN